MNPIVNIIFILASTVCVGLSCKSKNPSMVEHKEITGSEKINLETNFIPPAPLSLSQSETAKSLIEWFVNEAKLYDETIPNSIGIFRLFKTRDKKNYLIYLVLAKPSGKKDTEATVDVSRIGVSYQLEEHEYSKLDMNEALNKVEVEFHHFFEIHKMEARKFQNAKSINLTFDNYHITKLFPK